jgi:hypothetical protein
MLSPQAFNAYIKGPLHLQSLTKDMARVCFLGSLFVLCLFTVVLDNKMKLPRSSNLLLLSSTISGCTAWRLADPVFGKLQGRRSATKEEAFSLWEPILLGLWSAIGLGTANLFSSLLPQSATPIALILPSSVLLAILLSLRRYRVEQRPAIS